MSICHSFRRLAEESSPEVRMSRVVHWYLSSFRACQLEMNAARKPFNPVLGETFSCLWKVTNGIKKNELIDIDID